MSLTQLIGTMYDKCKVRVRTSDTTKKNSIDLALLHDKNLREICKEVNLDEKLNKRQMRNLDME